ncbi:hypothetical protein RHGRI_037308 [Rhododendron griersonianum]|uniref:UDP-3-O-acylglucosamine N-acyltransferase 2, mitochondrial n=1 Tax=Rhododendron griersonianum TaxID=479676 RepID=A0AAV6HWS1_9ERIC|nr:hypothetical protein RHGRI_037308 [Rhododendron griersonianum]
MALRRLAIVGSVSTPISRLASPNPHVISTRRPISDFVRRHHFSASTDESASKVASINPVFLSSGLVVDVWFMPDNNKKIKSEYDVVLEDHQGFQNWHNGGGLFHKSACIAATAVIEIGAVVHPEAVIGANTHISSGTIVGPSVTIGQSTKLGYNVALGNCALGDCCVIHNGVCIGQDGFGFFVDDLGGMVKKPQILKALIGHNVEIGANTCIDRGSWRDTVIGDHAKIDNLVQIGHNVVIGKYSMLCGQVGIAGSVTIGDYVTLGGRVAVRDHVSIASKLVALTLQTNFASISCLLQVHEIFLLGAFDIALTSFFHTRASAFSLNICFVFSPLWSKEGEVMNFNFASEYCFMERVRLAANSCITKDINVPGDYGGFPAVPVHEWRRQIAALRRTLK